MVKDGCQRKSQNYHYLHLCVYQRTVAERRIGCMNVCVQKGSWIPLCTQNWSHKDDLHGVTTVR